MCRLRVAQMKLLGILIFCASTSVNLADTLECMCGTTIASRIVHGLEMSKTSHPWMVEMYVEISQHGQSYILLCGGAIISSIHILSAAHCFKDFVSIDIYVGGHDSMDRQAYKRNIKKILTHNQYDTTTHINDIALVTLIKPIRFDGVKVSPICLPSNPFETYAAATATAMGWGRLSEDSHVAGVIMETDLDVLSNKECTEKFRITSLTITDGILCAHRSGTDACQGDSGGPLVYFDTETSRYIIIGIISNGIGCATKYPGLYTRVTEYLPWITRNIVSGDVCAL